MPQQFSSIHEKATPVFPAREIGKADPADSSMHMHANSFLLHLFVPKEQEKNRRLRDCNCTTTAVNWTDMAVASWVAPCANISS